MSPRVYDPEIEPTAKTIPMLDLANVEGARQTVRDFVDSLVAAGAIRPTDATIREIERTVPRSRDGGAIPIRIYQPTEPSGSGGLFLNFHAGGFVLGDLETEHARCLQIASRLRIPAIGVDYRLAPEHPFPAGIEDCYDVFAWASAVTDELGVDPRKIVIGGGSAGGCLTAAVSLMARDRGGPVAAMQMLLYPVIDQRCDTRSMAAGDDCYIWNRQNNLDMWRQYLGAESSGVPAYASPARATDLSRLPPAYVLTCEHDPLRDEGIQYAIRLLAAGVPVELHNIAGSVHAFDLLTPSAAADRAINDQVEAVRRAISFS